MEIAESYLLKLEASEKILIYNSIILPKRINQSRKSIKSSFHLFFEVISKSLSENPYADLIPSKKFGTIQDTLKKWRDLQKNETLDTSRLHQTITGLNPGESFPVFLRHQNCCLIINEENYKSSLTVSAFQVSASNHDLSRPATQLYVKCPSMTVKVKNKNLLKSEQFSELLADLGNNRKEISLNHSNVQVEKNTELNTVESPALVFEWILNLLTERNAPVADEIAVIKKYNDSVVSIDDTSAFRRNPIWVIIKSFFHLLFSRMLGLEFGRIVYKAVMLKAHFIVCLFFDPCSLEFVFECLQKTAKRIKKLEDLIGEDPVMQSVCDEGKFIISYKRKESENAYLEHVLSLEKNLNLSNSIFSGSHSISLCNIEGLARKILEISQKRTFFYNPQTKSIPIKCLKFKMIGNLPDPSIFDNSDEIQLRNSLIEFENWVKLKLNIKNMKFNDKEIKILFELLSDYIKCSKKLYQGDPLNYSQFIITSFKLYAIMDKNVCDRYELVKEYNIGLEVQSLKHLMLPSSSDVLNAKNIIDYFRERFLGDDKFITFFSENEEISKESFSSRFYANSNQCKSKKGFLTKRQVACLDWANKQTIDQINKYEKCLKDYQSTPCECSYINPLCYRCALYLEMKKMKIRVYVKDLPPEDWIIEQLAFELCIPKIMSLLRDATYLIKMNILELKFESEKVEESWLKTQRIFKNYDSFKRIINLRKSNPTKYELKDLCDEKEIFYHKIDKSDSLIFFKQIQMKSGDPKKYFKDPEKFIIESPYNLKLCANDTHYIFQKNNASVKKNCRLELENKFNGLSRLIDTGKLLENDIIAEFDKCPDGITINELRTLGFFKSGKYLILLQLLEALESRNLPFHEASTHYLLTQSLWKLGCLTIEPIKQSDLVCPAVQILFSNNYYLNKLYVSLNAFYLNNQHNWTDNLIAYTIVIIALRYIHFSSFSTYTQKMIKLLKDIRKTLIEWQEKIEKIQKYDKITEKSLNQDLDSKLFQISCTTILTYYLDQDYSHLIISDNIDLIHYLKSFNQIKILRNAGYKMINQFELFLFNLVNRVAKTQENDIQRFVKEKQGSPLRDYLKEVYSREEDQKFDDFCYSFEFFGFFVYYKTESLEKNQVFVGLDGSFLVNGLTYSKLPEIITKDKLYQNLFRGEVFLASSVKDTYETETKNLDDEFSYKFQFKFVEINENNYPRRLLIIKELIEGKNLKKEYILIPEDFFNELLPLYFIENFSHWLDVDSRKIEFKDKTFKTIKPDQSVYFTLDINSNILSEVNTNRSLIMINSKYFDFFYDEIFYRIDEKKYTHIYFDMSEKIVYIEFPRHNLSFSKEVSSPDIISKEFNGYKISSSQIINTLFGLGVGLVLEASDNLGFKNKKMIVPNASFKLSTKELHQVISHDFTTFNTPSFFSYELDERLQILKGEESIESWLFLAYLHAITSSILPDPFLGRQGTVRSLEILQSGHCFSCSPLSEESKKILNLISDLSPKRSKISTTDNKIQKVEWPLGLSSAAASDLFILLCKEILYKCSRLQFLYQDSRNDQLNGKKQTTGSKFSHFHKDLYLASYFKEIREDYKIAPWFKGDLVQTLNKPKENNLLFFGENYVRDHPNIKTIQMLSTQSYSPSQDLDLLNDFKKRFNFKGLSKKPYDFTKISDLVNVSKDLLSNWFDLYEFSKNTSQVSLLITLTGLAYLGVNRDYLLLFQIVSNSAEIRENLKFSFADHYYRFNEFHYPQPEIKAILEKHLVLFRDDKNPLKLIQHLGETQAQFNARKIKIEYDEKLKIIQTAELHISSQWSMGVFAFYDDRFDIEKIKEDVKFQFKSRFNNKDLTYFFENLKKKVNSFEYYGKNIRIESYKHAPELLVEMKQFSLEFESKLLKNLSEHEKYQEILKIYTNGWNLNENLIIKSSLNHSEESLNFPFNDQDSKNALKSYFISDLRNSWNNHLSTQETTKLMPEIHSKLQDLAVKYKKKSETFKKILKKSAIPAELNYLSEAFLLPSFHPSRILHLLRHHHDKNQVLSTSKEALEDVNPLEAAIGTICVFWSLEQRILRCLYFYSQGATHEHFLRRELETVPFLNWRPKDYPLWLILQVETDMMIRPTQVVVAESMISPSSNKNTVMQLNMGEGKTSLIIPMVVLVLANKAQLVRLTVLKSLFNINRAALAYKLGGCLNRKVFTLPLKRDIHFDAPSTTSVNQVLRECLQEQGVFLVLPDQRLSFILKGMELSRDAKTATAGCNLLTIQSRLDEKTRDLIDESDEILNPKYQLIYTIGKPKPVQCGRLRWLVVQEILEAMQKFLPDLHLQYPDCLIYETFENSPKRFPIVRLVNEKPYKKLCLLVTESILKSSRLISFPELETEETYDLVFQYITSESNTLERTQQVFHCFKSPSQLEVVLLLKGILSCQILLSCLLKRWRVNYGVNTQKLYLMQAVPFKAKDIPADKSQFAHPDIAILLTQLSYFYSGLNEQQLDEVFIRLKYESDGLCVYESWIEELSQSTHVDHSVRTLKGVNLKDKQQKLGILIPLLKYNQRAINYWLSHYLYPKEAKQFEGKLSLSFWDLCTEKPFPMTGFSGTNDSKILLPLTVGYFDVPGLIGTNGSLIYDLMRPENQRYDYFRQNISGPDLLAQVSAQSFPINVLLDVGALMLELTNKEVIEEWLKIRKDAKAGVFFDEFNNLVVLSRTGQVVPFEISPFRYHLVDCLVYLDDSHTRGTDLKIPKDTVAAVTLGNGVSKDKLMQGCMRMRMLGKGHSVMFFASSEVHQTIQSGTQNMPTGTDVLKWSLENTITQTSDNFLYWGLQGIAHYKRQVLYEKYFKSKEFKKFSTLSEDPDIPNIRLLYGRNRKETLIPSIIQSKTSIVKDKIQNFSVDLNRFFELCQSLVSQCSAFVSNQKKFAHLLDEEQELELEIEADVEAQAQKLELIRIKPEIHSFERDVKFWFEKGEIPEESLVFHNIYKGLGITSLKNLNEPLAWSDKVWVTLDFMRTVSITSDGDYYLKPVRWLGFTGTAKNPKDLVILSSFEANILMEKFKNGPVKLFLYSPRSRASQMNLFNEQDSQIPLNLMQSLNVFAGNEYFSSQKELDGFLKFIGYCPAPRTPSEKVFLSRGMIKNNGFVEPHFRDQVFGKDNQCNFKNDPAELVLKIIEKRNFRDSSKFGHVVDVLVHGKRPEVRGD